MGFNASLLSHDEDKVTECMNNFVSNPNNESYIYDLLEMNDTYHDMDVYDKIAYYRSLLEASNNESVNESKVINARDFIARLIEPIIRFLTDLCRKISGVTMVNQIKYEKLLKEHKHVRFPENSWYNKATERYKVKVFEYPNIEQINTNKYKECLVGLMNDLSEVCNNKVSDDMIKQYNYPAIKDLAKAVNDVAVHKYSDASSVKNMEDFRDMIKSSICVSYQEEMDYNKYIEVFMNARMGRKMKGYKHYSDAINVFTTELNKAKSMKASAAINSKEQEDYITTIISRIKEIVDGYTVFIESIRKTEDSALAYNIRFYENHVLRSFEQYSANESAEIYLDEESMIHGEPFNSNTLFDNEDLRDFNRTEWLDLSLTSECYQIKHELMEQHKRIACLEAEILADENGNKFNRLIAMREAEEKKTQNRIGNIIKYIGEMLSKFVEGIKAKVSTAANKIRRNTQFIAKPVKLKSIKSKGDILAGMDRLSKPINIIPFTYETLKDDLSSKEKFFVNRVLPSMKDQSQFSKRKLEYKDGMPITEYCKAYYGAAMPEDKYPVCEFAAKDIEPNKNEIVTFLNNTNTVFSCKNDLTKLEAEAKKFSSSYTTKPQEAQQQNTNTQNNAEANKPQQAQPKQESMYYSELYNRYFTEAEIEMGETNNGENTTVVNKSNSEEENAYRVYLDCYKDIILSKMTAAEFVYSELSQIINAHCTSYMTPEQKKAEADATAKDSGVVKTGNAK